MGLVLFLRARLSTPTVCKMIARGKENKPPCGTPTSNLSEVRATKYWVAPRERGNLAAHCNQETFTRGECFQCSNGDNMAKAKKVLVKAGTAS